jgi:hypothetical protein
LSLVKRSFHASANVQDDTDRSRNVLLGKREYFLGCLVFENPEGIRTQPVHNGAAAIHNGNGREDQRGVGLESWGAHSLDLILSE